MNPDLRNVSYDEFLDFVFDHTPKEDLDAKEWYWTLDAEVQIQPSRAIAYLTRMCQSAEDLVGRFTLSQIAQGMWYLFGAGGGSLFRDQFWNSEVPWPDRRACIVAIPNLYTEVFERAVAGIETGIESCAYMLWDMIAYSYYSKRRNPTMNAEDARVQDAMFAALSMMLRSDHPDTLYGAIHGLGHLCHRDGQSALRALLASKRRIHPNVREYATQVLEGHFL